MSRAYRGIRLHSNYVYAVEDVMRLYGICRNTVSNWVRDGQRPSDNSQPYLFRGAELIRFQKARQTVVRLKGLGVFQCLGCKLAVIPDISDLVIIDHGRGKSRAQARCPACGGCVSKLLNETDRTALQFHQLSNTSLESLVEGICNSRTSIGKSPPCDETYHSQNDRLLHRWLGFAGRYDKKTIAAHLSSIRAFEAFCIDPAESAQVKPLI